MRPTEFANPNLIRLWHKHNGACFYCKRQTILLIDAEAKKRYKKKIRKDKLRATRDHVIPKCRGGPNAATNIVLACAGCNTAKGSMTLDEFTTAKLWGCDFMAISKAAEAGYQKVLSDTEERRLHGKIKHIEQKEKFLKRIECATLHKEHYQIQSYAISDLIKSIKQVKEEKNRKHLMAHLRSVIIVSRLPPLGIEND